MKKNLVYILGVIVALLILFSGWCGKLKAVESGSKEVLMFINNNDIRRSAVKTGYRFAKQSDIQQTATKTVTSYLAIGSVPDKEHDYDLTTE